MEKAQILVVEDERIVAKNIQNKLKKFGYDIPAVAYSGEEAIKKIAETHPDLVLMDINLEGDMDGIQAAEQIRTRFDIPVIYLTAYADEETMQRAKVTEPYSYILKPFQAEELQTNIELALYKHKMDKELRESEEQHRTLFKGVYKFLEAEEEKTKWTTKLFHLWNRIMRALSRRKETEKCNNHSIK